mgnify:CR=1 FL=1
MSNSIWKMRDVEPKKYPILALGDDGKYYVFESPKLGTGDLGWKHRCHDYVKQYCYIDDLIAQADKAERLQKAVDLIANMEQRLCIDDPVDILDDVLKIAKDEIKQLIKGE